MTRTVVVLLGAGFVAVVIAIVILFKILYPPDPETRAVEITAPKGTQAFERLPDEREYHLGDLVDNSLTVDVRVDAAIALKYKGDEKTFPPEKWKGIKLVEHFDPPEPPPPPRVVSVSVNAVPWAEVYIKLPGTDQFVKPPKKKSNVTPIRGGLRIPIGTAIKLVYGNREKTFGYEAWKASKTISHDFSKP